jgi:L-amino acid N-acyltransferase YncA
MSLNLPVQIRQATVADAESVAAVWISGVPDAFGVSAPSEIEAKSWFEERLQRQTEAFCYRVAQSGCEVIGWCSLQPCRNNPLSHSKMAEISTYIAPAASQQGVARALIQHLIDHSADVGIAYVVGHARSGEDSKTAQFDGMDSSWSNAA